MGMGSVPRALRARGSPATTTTNNNNDNDNDNDNNNNTTSLSAPEVKKFVPSGCYEVT